MYIRKLKIVNFRNISAAEIEPSAGFNVLVGENAQGKTNTAEAAQLALTGHSHRETVNENFIGPEGKPAYISVDCVLDDGAGYTAECRMERGKSRVHTVNNEIIKSRAELIRDFPVVFFSPEDLRIVSDAPAARRAFLNEAVSAIYPPYALLLNDYNRTLRQRNILLKDYAPSAAALLEVYDEKAVELGSDIARYRIKFLSECEKAASEYYRFISGQREDISLNYVSNVLDRPGITDVRRAYDTALRASREDDIFSRSTTRGIHHDDIAIFISGRPARKFGSRGQCRSAAICLKLSLTGMILARRGVRAVVILDDVMSELDASRRAQVVEMLSQYQVFITCVAQDFDTKNYDKKVFHVENGVITGQTGEKNEF